MSLSGHKAIQIVRIDVSDLVRTNQIGTGESAGILIPSWQGARIKEQGWFNMAEIGSVLGIDPRLVSSAEWLACGFISSARYSGAWPVINRKLYLQEGRGEDLGILLIRVSGRAPDHIVEPVGVDRYDYDWDHKVFIERESSGTSNEPAHRIGVAGASMGLGIAASCFARPTVFGYAGYLRGMKIMD